MANEQAVSRRGNFAAVVRLNRRIGERFYRLGLEFSGAGAEAFLRVVPGQFAQIDLCEAAVPGESEIPGHLRDAAKRKVLLRRPFSFCDVSIKGKTTFAEILYRAVGPASLRMTSLAVGASVSVLGPLGRGFLIPGGKKKALLISGGMGAGPLLYLAKVLTEQHGPVEVRAFAGAKTAKDLPFEGRGDEISQELGFTIKEFARYGIESNVASDDGSAGCQGPVTDCFYRWLEEAKPRSDETIIYACGPEAMLKRTAEIARDRHIDCQVSMERRMACGIGVCQSCVVECRDSDSGRSVQKLCCEDGPVFDGAEVMFVQ